MLGSLGSVTNSHWALANGQESYLFKELKCYKFSNNLRGFHFAEDKGAILFPR
jgi:hypothetical protein